MHVDNTAGKVRSIMWLATDYTKCTGHIQLLVLVVFVATYVAGNYLFHYLLLFYTPISSTVFTVK